MYSFISHLDEAPRYAGLTLDELIIGAVGLLSLVITNHKFVVSALSFGLYGLLKHIKKGNGPRYFYVLIYWHLPKNLGLLVAPKLPASHLRVWRA